MTSQQFTAPISRLWQGVEHAVQVWATRRELSQLDDRMLKDLGISRAQAEFEAGSRDGIWHIVPHHDA